MKRTSYTALRITVSVAAVSGLLWLMRDRMGEIFATLGQTRIWLFVLAYLTYLSTMAIFALRLKRIISAQGIALSLKELFHLTLIGHFFNNFLPTSIGGDLVKAYYASKRTRRSLESFTSVLVDRMVGFFSLVLIASIALAFIGKSIENAVVRWAILMMLIGSVVFVLLIFYPALTKKFVASLTPLRSVMVGTKLRRLHSALSCYKGHKKIVWQAFYLSIASQGIVIFVNYLFARSLMIAMPLKSFFLLMPIIFAVSMLPSLGGLGIREGAYVYFFKGVIGPEGAFSLSLLHLASLLGISLVGGVVYALKGQFRSNEAQTYGTTEGSEHKSVG